VEPTRTSPGFGVTVHEATWLATGAVAQAPLRQAFPLPHCASLPHTGERQTASSQTSLGVAAVWHPALELQVFTQTELRQTCLPPLPVQSASLVQAAGPESLRPWLPLPPQPAATMAASVGAKRISRWITWVPSR